MSTRPTNPIPEVYVLWHPQCPLGEALAKRIYSWLRPGNGLGPQVFYRSLAAPEELHGLPLALPEKIRYTPGQQQETSDWQIVLPLIDENMVADPAWQRWLGEMCTDSWGAGNQRMMLPVALDTTAYNMPGEVQKLNYLRPVGLPLSNPSNLDEAEVKVVAHSLLKQLTEALCNLLLLAQPRKPDKGAPATWMAQEAASKVTLFLSHAKVDGTEPARRLRDYIYSQTQLQAFYDENDIPYGSAFGAVIQEKLAAANLAAMLVIRSTRYASRPWCRRELATFRQPQQEEETDFRRWRLYPALVVEAMEGSEISAGIPKLGNSAMIRWNSAEKEMEELIVTTVIRDTMLGAVHSALGAFIPLRPNQFVINWLPDPTSVLSLLRCYQKAKITAKLAKAERQGKIPTAEEQKWSSAAKLAAQAVEAKVAAQIKAELAQELFIAYPGRGLTGLELDILFEYFPNITFRSFEDVLTEEGLT